MTELNRGDLLEALLGIGGVMGAAFVSGDGEILEGRAAERDFADVSLTLSSCLASSRLLSELLGAEVASQTTFEFALGTLLLTRAVPDTDLAVVVLTQAEEADRVRFGLRRLLPQLSGATDNGEANDGAASDGEIDDGRVG